MNLSTEFPIVPMETAWSEATSHQYLIQFLKDRKNLLALKQYPTWLDGLKFNDVLDEAWWKTIQDPLRRESANIFLINQGNGTLHTLDTATIGNTGSIPMEIINRQKQKGGQSGLTTDTGYIQVHTHPDNTDKPSFSLADIYNLIKHPNAQIRAMFVAQSKYNLAVFQCQDTKFLGSTLKRTLSYPDFAKYWYDQFGRTFHKTDANGESASKANKPEQNTWEIVKTIASEHNLALYKGEADTRFRRIIPK